MNLNDRMSFGHVVQVHADGSVTDANITAWMPNVVYLELDESGQSLDDDFIDVPAGWAPLHGYTGQYGYGGPVMHPSEYIGGRMERDILAEPGYYVAVAVDGLPYDDSDDDLNIGWAVFYREAE